MTRDELLAALLAERYGTGGWFTGKPQPVAVDDERAGARRLAACVAEDGAA